MSRYLVTFSFLALAVVLYIIGFETSAIGLIVLGGIAELVFWVRAFRQLRRQDS